MHRALAPLLLLAGACGGNVTGSRYVELATMTSAESGVEVTDLALEILDVRGDDGKTHKVHTLRFTAAGDPLQQSGPGFKYACAAGDVVLTAGFIDYGNLPEAGKNTPRIGLIALDDYLKATGAAVSACEFTLTLAERGPHPPLPARKARRPLGSLCYRNGALTDGGCPAGTLERRPDPAAALTARILDPRPITVQPGDHASLAFSTLLTLHRLPAAGISVTFETTCKGQTGTTILGATHFDAVAPGESIWFNGPSLDPAKHADAKQCELAVLHRDGETSTEVARQCFRDGAVHPGACG